ncbi:NADPH-dependent 7-cyano-7-deazaguanine reductase [bacterium BMS3Abin03]|nr:NADPH-dependent 7-cyano-7-deazaguanine reductase [bacterium BMS3Abin03]
MEDKIKLLETFENQYPDRDYSIIHEAPEFTSLCPKTGQPDFATIVVEYVPDKLCIELKSLKLYLNTYRNDGIFYESVTNKILDDLVTVCKPRYMIVTAEFNVRGGISSIIETEYKNPEFFGSENFN